MSLTTVAVSIQTFQITGEVLPRAVVRFELTSPDVQAGVGIIAPDPVLMQLDDAGQGTVELWPNALGTQGTQYRVQVEDESGRAQFAGLATVPNSACNLHDTLSLSPPAVVDDAQAAALAAQGYAAQTGALLAGDFGTASVSGTWFGSVVATVASLAQTAGAALIGFIQNSAGAVARSLLSKLFEMPVSVFDFMTASQIYDVQTRAFLLDHTAAIQAAIDALAANGGGKLYFPPGLYRVLTQLNVTESVRFMCDGWGDTSITASAPDTFLTEIRYDGVNTGTSPVILVKSTTASAWVWNWGFDGDVCLNGNNKAYVFLQTSSCRRARINGSLWIQRCRFFGWQVDDGNGVIGGANGYCEQFNYLAGSNPAAAGSGGIKITSLTSAGCTGLVFADVLGTLVNGNLMEFGDVDNCKVFSTHATISGTGQNCYFRGLTDGQTRPSRKNRIGYISGAGIYAEAKSLNWGVINSEGTWATIEANAVFHYDIIDRNTGARWRSPMYAAHQKRGLDFHTGYNPNSGTSTAAIVIDGGMDLQAVSFPKSSANQDWQWVLPPPPDWSTGRILGFDVQGMKPTSTNAGNVVLRFQVKNKGDRNGPGGAFNFNTPDTVHAVDAAASRTVEPFSVTLNTAQAYTKNDNLIVRVSRIGSDAGDTYPDAWELLSLGVQYQANVANSDSPSWRYGVSTDAIT